MSLLSIFKNLFSKKNIRFTPEYTQKIYLDIPYSQKDIAKARGAQWDRDNKKWFITKDKNFGLFKEWMTSERPNLKAKYFYLAQTTSPCYKCTKPSLVNAIVLPEGFESIDEEANEEIETQENILNQPQFCTQEYLSILSYVTYISPKALDEIYKHTSSTFFAKKHSMTTNHS